jgi:hypothetical protein
MLGASSPDLDSHYSKTLALAAENGLWPSSGSAFSDKGRSPLSDVSSNSAGGRGKLCRQPPHSHSMVAGGFPEMSYTTREIPGTSLTMRRETSSRKS